MKSIKLPGLTTCIILDLLGMASYLLPVLGETFDFIWAPISGILFFYLFGMKKFGMIGGIISIIEEISPGFDIIPTFTIAWIVRKNSLDKQMVKKITD
ncbi:MAG: hypothetical protein ABIW47_18540 [Ginsengibacter sp.]